MIDFDAPLVVCNSFGVVNEPTLFQYVIQRFWLEAIYQH